MRTPRVAHRGCAQLKDSQAPAARLAQYGYDYANQDPINGYDLDGLRGQGCEPRACGDQNARRAIMEGVTDVVRGLIRTSDLTRGNPASNDYSRGGGTLGALKDLTRILNQTLGGKLTVARNAAGHVTRMTWSERMYGGNLNITYRPALGAKGARIDVSGPASVFKPAAVTFHYR